MAIEHAGVVILTGYLPLAMKGGFGRPSIYLIRSIFSPELRTYQANT
jgi:hypothetical protein